MADLNEQEQKNRCYLFVQNSYSLKCSVCGSKTSSKIYEYRYKKKMVKGFANYCPICRAFFIYYGNYIVRPKYWEVLNSRDEIKQLSAEYHKICQRQVMAKSKKGKQKNVEKYQKYYEIPNQWKILEYERLNRNKKARKSKERAAIEEQKIALIKKKLESKEQNRIQQLKEFEKKRENEFNRRLAESRRRSLEKKRESQSIGKTDLTHTISKYEEKKVSKPLTTEQSVGCDYALREQQAGLNKTIAHNYRTIKKQTDSINHEITAHDFVVRSSSSVFKCRNKLHQLQDVRAVFRSISRMGTVRELEIPAGYCPQCNIYFILESTFERIKRSGVPICRTMDEKTYVCNNYNGSSMDITLAQESVLMQFGYTVSQTEDLPMIQRRAILAAVVDYKVLTKNEVISYLDYFIRYRKNQRNQDGSLRYGAAIEKWKEDREFISHYKIGNYTKVAMKRIITNKD